MYNTTSTTQEEQAMPEISEPTNTTVERHPRGGSEASVRKSFAQRKFARQVACPRCRARAGKPCLDSEGEEQLAVHAVRAELAGARVGGNNFVESVWESDVVGPPVKTKRASELSDVEADRLGLGRWFLCAASEESKCPICGNQIFRGGPQVKRLHPLAVVCTECARDDSLEVDWNVERKLKPRPLDKPRRAPRPPRTDAVCRFPQLAPVTGYGKGCRCERCKEAKRSQRKALA
jgi:hypothetical protein